MDKNKEEIPDHGPQEESSEDSPGSSVTQENLPGVEVEESEECAMGRVEGFINPSEPEDGKSTNSKQSIITAIVGPGQAGGAVKHDEEGMDYGPGSENSDELSTDLIQKCSAGNSLGSQDDSVDLNAGLIKSRLEEVREALPINSNADDEEDFENKELCKKEGTENEDDQIENGETPAESKPIFSYGREDLLPVGRARKYEVDIPVQDIIKIQKAKSLFAKTFAPRSGSPEERLNPPPGTQDMGPRMTAPGQPLAAPPTPTSTVIKASRTKVELHKDENPWKPSRCSGRGRDQNLTPDERQTDQIVRQTRSFLNKLTPANFEKVCERLLELELNDRQDRILAVTRVIFESAVRFDPREPSYAQVSAQLIKHFCQHSLENAKKLRKEILDQCQREFQKANNDENAISEKEKKVLDAPDEESKLALRLELEEYRFGLRMRSLGAMKFIGELFKVELLIPRIIVDCVKELLGTNDEDSYECLCILLKTVGQTLENSLREQENRVRDARSRGQPLPRFIPEANYMDKTFAKLKKLSKETTKLSSRIRFALLDLADLRESNWVPRRELNALKSVDKDRQDSFREEKKRQINLLPKIDSSHLGQLLRSKMNQSLQPKMGSDWNTVSSAMSSRYSQVKKANEPLTSSPILNLQSKMNQSLQPKMGSDWNSVSSAKSSRFSQVKKANEPLTSSPIYAPPVWGSGGSSVNRSSSSSTSSSNNSFIPPRFQRQQQQMQQQQLQQNQGGQMGRLGGVMPPLDGDNRFNSLSTQSSEQTGINLISSSSGGGGGSTGGPQPPSQLNQSSQQHQRSPPFHHPSPSSAPPPRPQDNVADVHETVKNIFQEYLTIQNAEDTLFWIKDRFPGNKILEFVDELSREVAEMAKEQQQVGAGKLVRMLIKQKYIERDQVLDVIIKGIMPDLPDIQVDSPKATSYVAMFVLEVFGDESSLDWLLELSEPLHNEDFQEAWADLITTTLNLFKLKRNEQFVKSLWNNTKTKDSSLYESLPWLGPDESQPSLVNKMISPSSSGSFRQQSAGSQLLDEVNAWEERNDLGGVNPLDSPLKQTVRNAQAILRTLNHQNLDLVFQKFMNEVELSNQDDLIAAVVRMLFEEAASKPLHAKAYAQFLNGVLLHQQPATAEIFRNRILNECRKEFEKTQRDEADIIQEEKNISEEPGQGRTEDFRLKLEGLGSRSSSVGIMKFIRDVIKLKLVPPNAIAASGRLLCGIRGGGLERPPPEAEGTNKFSALDLAEQSE